MTSIDPAREPLAFAVLERTAASRWHRQTVLRDIVVLTSHGAVPVIEDMPVPNDAGREHPLADVVDLGRVQVVHATNIERFSAALADRGFRMTVRAVLGHDPMDDPATAMSTLQVARSKLSMAANYGVDPNSETPDRRLSAQEIAAGTAEYRLIDELMATADCDGRNATKSFAPVDAVAAYLVGHFALNRIQAAGPIHLGLPPDTDAQKALWAAQVGKPPLVAVEAIAGMTARAELATALEGAGPGVG